MPVLAIGEEGDGRTVALAVDGTWELEFSELGAHTAGRGHGALWDGLLGWLMRDPRFEPAQLGVVGGCTAGQPPRIRVRLPQAGADEARSIVLDVSRLDKPAPPVHVEAARKADATSVDVGLPALEAGGYTARLRVGEGATTRYDFACEEGGDEWADSRPDPARLRALARVTGGAFAFAADAGSLPLPKPTRVSAERHVTPLAPPWSWTAAAAVLLGVHWIARRRSGLA